MSFLTYPIPCLSLSALRENAGVVETTKAPAPPSLVAKNVRVTPSSV